MADKDEEWNGPVEEASKPLGERMETMEAGDTPEPVTEAVPPIEERVARLERIAEYLHDARKLAASVETLADATKALTELLIVIETHQQRIESLDERVGATEVDTEAFRERVVRRSVAIGLSLILVLIAFGAGLVAYDRDRVGDVKMRCEARNAQADITADTFREVLAILPEDAPSAVAIQRGLVRFKALIVDCEGVASE